MGPTAPTARRRLRPVAGLLELPVIAVLAIVIVVGLRAFVVQPFYIPSGSMIPQLEINDKIVVSRVSYRLHRPRRGDVVVFAKPPNAALDPGTVSGGGALGFATRRLGLVPTTDQFVKRVVALPGETVEGRGGHVFIDGHLLIEPYLPFGVRTDAFAPQRVRPGQLWVMGDNRSDSEDSRFFGTVPSRTVVGRAILKVWPLTDLSFL